MATDSKRSVPIKLDHDTRKRIKRLAVLRGHNSHWIICTAIAQYIEREEKGEAMRREMLKMWLEQNVASAPSAPEMVDEWIDRLKTVHEESSGDTGFS